MSPDPRPKFLQVILPVPRYQTYTYRLPETWRENPRPGQLLWVPFGRKKQIGMVADLRSEAPIGLEEIKEVLEPLPADYGLEPELWKLFQWATQHYLSPPGEVLRTFFPNSILKGKLDKGERARSPSPTIFSSQNGPVTLNPDQNRAVTLVKEHLGTFFPILLQGITGSGKTEVYLRLCDEVLARGGGVLVLVPEIALTPQMLSRFVDCFVDKVGTYHSAMTDTQRLQTYWGLKEGRQRIVVGTRSAACLPVKNLSLIIVDEEHDSSYKQEERFRYHGRDLAVVRAKMSKIPVLLGTATPALESRENVERGKYHFLKLPHRATAKAQLPKVHLVDLRRDRPHPDTLLSVSLREKLLLTLERKEQALFFLNRRGFAPFLLCTDCGEVVRCPNCEISLTMHKAVSRLICHYCDFYLPILEQCPACPSDQLQAYGSGTERIEESFQKAFPGVRIGRLDRDVAQSRKKTEEMLSQFETGKIDILIGTQLITKGHDFKRLTLVGILQADVTLNLPDFRAPERVFQIVTQVAGRAGRHELPGEVFLQTYRPEHYAITAAMAQDPEAFFVQERVFRKELSYPPFTRIIQLKLLGSRQDAVARASRKVADSIQTLMSRQKTVNILGPAPAIFERLRGKYRWQILIRSQHFESMRSCLVDNLPHLEQGLEAGVRLQVDVDPVGIF